MRKVCKMIIICIFVSCITFVSYAADLNELQEQKTDIQNQIDKKNQELIDVNEELTENLKQIQKLDSNIQQTSDNLHNLENEINKMEEQIATLENEIKIITRKYNTQKEILDSRLVAMYESKNTTYLDVVLSSNSITDFLSTYYLLSEITSYDMDLLELVETEKNNIEKINKEVNIQKEKLEKEKRTAQKTQITLSNTKLLRENYISKLSEEEQKLQASIDEYNTQVQQIEEEIKSLVVTASFGEDYKGGQMQWPIKGYNNITSNYGMRVHPITGVYKLHTGVDIGAPLGTSFTAMANGIVVKAEYNSAYGNMVIIDHGGGVQTLYAHGSEIVAKLGQEVLAGEEVLKVGSTGYSTGPHAHFEVRINGTPANPLDYVSNTQE